MARGTQHRKRRTQANARVAAAPAKAPKSKRVKHQRWEDQLFFARLRLHAKWVFAFLALVFAGTFVFLGVGSGSTGIGDALQSLLNGSSSSSTSASSLQKKAEAHPKQAVLWHNLATKLEADGNLDGAVTALKRYTALKPKDSTVIEELASVYLRQADDARQQYIDAQTRTQILAPTLPSSPKSTSDIGKAFSSLVSPIQSALSSVIGTSSSTAYSNYFTATTLAVTTYKQLASLNPKDATTQIRLAQVAQSAGDTKTAIAAYERFLKLAPDDSLAPSAKKALKQLEAQQASTATGSSTGK